MNAYIEIITFDIYLPGSDSLKQKRQQLNRIRDLVAKQTQLAATEVDFQDEPDRSRWSFVGVGQNQRQVQSLLAQLEKRLLDSIDGEVRFLAREPL